MNSNSFAIKTSPEKMKSVPDIKDKSGQTKSVLARLVPAVVILAALFAGYSETFHFPFQFDDRMAVEANPVVKDLSKPGRIWSYNPARFITFLSLAVSYHFSGLDVFGYHVFNFTVHFITAMLFYWLASLIASTKYGFAALGGEDGTENPAAITMFPLFAAALFTAHPLQTEAVTYIWQRNTSMVAMFYVLSLALYLKSSIMEEKEGASTGESRLLLAGSIAAAVAAMFTKQNAVTLPVAIVLAEYFFISGSLKNLKMKAPRLALFLPVMLIIPTLTALHMNQELQHIGARHANMLSPYEYLLTQFNVIVTVYLKLLVFPAGQSLDYNFPASLSIMDSLASFVFLVFLVAAALWLFNRNRIASFGILFFFLAISVESSFFPLEDLVFEHRAYLPSIGFFLAILAIAFQMTAKVIGAGARKALVVALSIIVVALSAATRARNEVWRSHESLWMDVAEKHPTKTRASNNLGLIYLQQKNYAEAEKWFNKALAVKPDSNFALYYLGHIYTEKGMMAEAVDYLSRAVEINPVAIKAQYALANAYMKTKDYPRAALHYKIALKLEGGGNVEALSALGTALLHSGRLNEAIKKYEKIVEIDPDNEMAYGNLSALYTMKGMKRKADYYKEKEKEAAARNS